MADAPACTSEHLFFSWILDKSHTSKTPTETPVHLKGHRRTTHFSESNRKQKYAINIESCNLLYRPTHLNQINVTRHNTKMDTSSLNEETLVRASPQRDRYHIWSVCMPCSSVCAGGTPASEHRIGGTANNTDEPPGTNQRPLTSFRTHLPQQWWSDTAD